MNANPKPNRPSFYENALAGLQRHIGWAVTVGLVLYAAALAIVHYAPMPSWLTSARGFAIAKLGPLGDSFGPLTAIFAAVAACGAWKSYTAQREQLEQERGRIQDERARHDAQIERERERLEVEKNRYRGTRFDDTFFRLVEHYDEERAKLIITVPDNHNAFTKPGKREGADAVLAFKQSLKVFQHGDEKDVDAFAWGFGHKFFKPLLLLRAQEIAITRWLKRQSFNVKVDLRGALLVAKLTDEELWFWYWAIHSTGDGDLIKFASELGITFKRAVDAENHAEGR
jgi:hypothetical protein